MRRPVIAIGPANHRKDRHLRLELLKDRECVDEIVPVSVVESEGDTLTLARGVSHRFAKKAKRPALSGQPFDLPAEEGGETRILLKRPPGSGSHIMWYMRMRGALCGTDLLHHAKRNESHAR